MVVCKFGGTSMADARQIRKVVAIIEKDPARQLIVVSAPGKGSSAPWKVTDQLISIAQNILNQAPVQLEQTELFERFELMVHELGLGPQLLADLQRRFTTAIFFSQSDPEHYLARVKAFGEEASALILTAFLQRIGYAARFVDPGAAGLLLTGNAHRAQIMEGWQKRIAAALTPFDGYTIVPGFYGRNCEGDVLTFSRGGSDVSAALLAVALEAERYENWTDVSGVYAIDPRIIPDAPIYSSLNLREMLSMAEMGTNVLHQEALAPLLNSNVPLYLKNTNAPEDAGTLIANNVPRHNGITSICIKADILHVHFPAADADLAAWDRALASFALHSGARVRTAAGCDDYVDCENLFDSEKEALLELWREQNTAAEEAEWVAVLALVGAVDETILAQSSAHLAAAGIHVQNSQIRPDLAKLFIFLAADDAKNALMDLYALYFRQP